MFILFVSYDNDYTENTRIHETVASTNKDTLLDYVKRLEEEYYTILYQIKEITEYDFEVIDKCEL